MELDFLSINFYEIFITMISVIILGCISICLFFWFNGSNDKTSENSLMNHSSSNKKKIKRKINSIKSNKFSNSNGDLNDEKLVKNKHIEIKSSPEILEDSNKEIKVNLFLSPSKPILRKNDDQIFINEDNFHESKWSKIPKDEVEIRRSRQSSVVSDSRSTLKEELEEANVKLSRGQKKRLKAKLKTIDLKSCDKVDIQVNNSMACDMYNEETNNDTEENNYSSSKSISSKGLKKRLDKKTKNCSSNSTESSSNNEKLHSFSSGEFEDKNQCESSIEDFKIEDSESTFLLKPDNLDINPFVNHFNESEIQIKCNTFEFENKELKNEINNLKQKLNEISVMSSTIINLKKENEMFLKKHVDLERTCNAIQKELTNSLQKTNSADNRIIRLNTERNQQFSMYENEINKCNNKISILETDIRSKTTDNENLKMSLEQMRHIVSDKEQLIQSQNNELSLLKEQCYKKRIDFQEIEVTTNNISLKLKDMENQNQRLIEENQKIKFQLETNEKNRQKEIDQLNMKIKNKEREQNSLVSSLQYQLDEYHREKQFSMFNTEIEDLKDENEKLKSQCQDLKRKYDQSSSQLPVGFELIEIEMLKELTLKINEGNRKLQEKCEQYNILMNQQCDKETQLLEKNSILENNYAKINSDLKDHLNEIVNLRKIIEELELNLSRNSENNIDELKVELDEKCKLLRIVEERLTKFETVFVNEDFKWKSLYTEKCLECEKLENELIQKASIISNENKKINELTSSSHINQSQSESILNGALSVE